MEQYVNKEKLLAYLEHMLIGDPQPTVIEMLYAISRYEECLMIQHCSGCKNWMKIPVNAVDGAYIGWCRKRALPMSELSYCTEGADKEARDHD